MNNKYRILVVEDEDNIRGFISALLGADGYQTVTAATCAEAKTLFASFMPDLTILDLGLPDADGMQFIKEARSHSPAPIIVLSARSDERDKVEALDAGANDYVTKPFGSAELLARVRSLLRSTRHSSVEGRLPGGKFFLGKLVIDYDARQVQVDGAAVHMTQTEYNILALLSEHCGKVMTYSAIIKAVWGYPDEGSIKKLQVNMANIRKKLGVRPGESRYIVNELGVGYRMTDTEE